MPLVRFAGTRDATLLDVIELLGRPDIPLGGQGDLTDQEIIHFTARGAIFEVVDDGAPDPIVTHFVELRDDVLVTRDEHERMPEIVALEELVESVEGDQADLNAAAVKVTGAQAVAGVKTFASSPVVPTVALGDTSTKAASMAAVAAAAEAIRANLRINVKDPPYNCTGLGLVDETLPIRAAIAALKAAGGGSLVFPAGIYLGDTATSANGISWIWEITGDGIMLDLDLGAILKTTQNAHILFFTGAGKAEGAAQWLKYVPWRFTGDTIAGGAAISPACPHAFYAMSAAAEGASSITLSTPADAGNLVAGDYIYIRTGQIVANGSTWNAEPDAEINRVRTATAGTGVVTLERPLAKPYASENQSAIGAISSVGGGGSAAPMGIVKVTDSTITNVGIRGGKLQNTVGQASPIQVLGTISGFIEEDLEFDCVGVANAALEYRDGTFRRLKAVMTGSHRGDFWPVTTAVGCSDVTIEDVTGIATQKIACLHLHEGGSRIKARGMRLLSADNSTSGIYPISIRARAYDVTVDDYTIIGGGNEAAIFIGATEGGGGKIGKGFVRGNHGRTMYCYSKNWTIEPPNDGKGGDMQLVLRATEAPIVRRTLQAWVSDDAQTVTLGIIPAQSNILGVQVDVYEAFNSDGTDLLDVGIDGATWLFSSGTVVSATTPVVAANLNTGYNDTSRIVKAYYVNGGSEPTTGKALVTIEYAACPSLVA